MLRDSVTLEEKDGVLLSRPPIAFQVDSQGAFLIADEASGRLLRYDSAGRLTATYGRPGDGPGEFRTMSPGTLAHGGKVAQLASRRINVFDMRTGYVSHVIPLAFAAGDIIPFRGQLLLPLAAPGSGYAVAAVPETVLDSSPPSIRPLTTSIVRLPVEYETFPGLDIFIRATIAAHGDELIAGFGGVDYLVLYAMDGTAGDTLRFPAVRRRGAPQHGTALYRTRDFGTYERRMAGLSSLTRIWVATDGLVITWHRDVTISRRANDYQFSGKAWISLLDLEADRSCPDLAVPFPGTSWPSMAQRGTSLYALDLVPLDSRVAQVRAVIQRYELDPSACQWVAMTRKPGSRRG